MKIDELHSLVILLKIPKIRKKLLLDLIQSEISIQAFVKEPGLYTSICPLNTQMKNELEKIKDGILNQGELAEISWLNASEYNHLITYSDDLYPERLRHISDPPLLLYLIGDPMCLSQHQVAIVGTRKPSTYGKNNAIHFASELAKSNIIVTSGMAYGIDVLAHQGALEANGKTIAVMGTGINLIYPSQNRAVAEKIIHNGAIISEFPLNTPPTKYNFPKRNRIISGLTQGTLVVEASLKSGTLITARHALEQGREIFAIPGNIYHDESKGCHWLIQEGAKLVTNIDDILVELNTSSAKEKQSNNFKKNTGKQKELQKEIDAQQQNILTYIGYQITALDSIIEKSGVNASDLSMILFELEINGFIESVPGGYRKL